MHRLLIRVGFLAVLAFVLAAPASAKSTGPCAVITRAEATTFLKSPVRPGLLQKFGSHVSCTYTTANYRSLTLQLNVVSKSAFEQAAKNDPKPVVRVYGVGNEAFSTAGGASLVLWKNGAQVTIDVTAADLKNVPNLEQQIGKATAARL